MEYLPNETKYPYLAEFLRSGGKLVIGADRNLESFAHIQIDNMVRTVDKLSYTDLADVLRTMNHQAKCHIEENW